MTATARPLTGRAPSTTMLSAVSPKFAGHRRAALRRAVASGGEGLHHPQAGQEAEVDDVLQRFSVVRQDAFERHARLLLVG